MNKRITTAANGLMIAAFLLGLAACQSASVADNKNTANANLTVSNGNTNSAITNANSNAAKPDSNSNVNAVEKTSVGNSASEKKSDGKLAERIVGLWEGKTPTGEKVGLDFRADNKVYPVSEDKKDADKPASYKVVDEENVELTTPDAKPETWKIKVNGDKMTVDAGGGKLEFTKAK